jgi:hypothetical protein
MGLGEQSEAVVMPRDDSGSFQNLGRKRGLSRSVPHVHLIPQCLHRHESLLPPSKASMVSEHCLAQRLGKGGGLAPSEVPSAKATGSWSNFLCPNSAIFFPCQPFPDSREEVQRPSHVTSSAVPKLLQESK